MSTFFRHAAPANQLASSAHLEAERVAAPPLPRKLVIWLTAAVAGTLVFPLMYTIEGAIRPSYDPLRQTISSLAIGPLGWMQQLNFALCGMSILWMALVWRKILAGGVCATWYPILRVVEGLGLIAIGIFTTDPLHTAFMIVIVQAMSIDLFVIARRFWGNPGWRGWVAVSVACALLPMVVMPFFGVGLNPHSALAGYDGLLERLATNADTIWSVALVARLWLRRPIGI